MRNYVIALYIRLSVEDSKTESLSIPNQRLILRERAMSLPEWENAEVLEFIDNGHTGTNFERPAVPGTFRDSADRQDQLYSGKRPFQIWAQQH